MPEEQLEAILQLDIFDEEVEWMKILALGCSMLGEVCSQNHRAVLSWKEPLKFIYSNSPTMNKGTYS